jgi:hypothetical protein
MLSSISQAKEAFSELKAMVDAIAARRGGGIPESPVKEYWRRSDSQGRLSRCDHVCSVRAGELPGYRKEGLGGLQGHGVHHCRASRETIMAYQGGVQRQQTFGLRLSEGERHKLSQLACEGGVSESDIVRLLLRAATIRGLLQPPSALNLRVITRTPQPSQPSGRLPRTSE